MRANDMDTQPEQEQYRVSGREPYVNAFKDYLQEYYAASRRRLSVCHPWAHIFVGFDRTPCWSPRLFPNKFTELDSGSLWGLIGSSEPIALEVFSLCLLISCRILVILKINSALSCSLAGLVDPQPMAQGKSGPDYGIQYPARAEKVKSDE